jgi:hypothetical protein
MNVVYWLRETARLRSELQHAESKLSDERRIRDIRAMHARVAAEREDWQWIPTDSAVLTADGTWAEK